MRYSPERKEAVLRKMMPPHNRTIKELAKEERISEATLYNWLKQARDKGLLMPDADTMPEGWTARDKFAGFAFSILLIYVIGMNFLRLDFWQVLCKEYRKIPSAGLKVSQ